MIVCSFPLVVDRYVYATFVAIGLLSFANLLVTRAGCGSAQASEHRLDCWREFRFGLWLLWCQERQDAQCGRTCSQWRSLHQRLLDFTSVRAKPIVLHGWHVRDHDGHASHAFAS